MFENRLCCVLHVHVRVHVADGFVEEFNRSVSNGLMKILVIGDDDMQVFSTEKVFAGIKFYITTIFNKASNDSRKSSSCNAK